MFTRSQLRRAVKKPWADIWNYLQQDWQVQIRHVMREANRSANTMAQESFGQHERDKVWTTPPRVLERILFEDSVKHEIARVQRIVL